MKPNPLGNNAPTSANAQVAVIIEGHCDQRGSTEYNLALGENVRRSAEIPQQFRVNQDRLSVVSYGEEQLADYQKPKPLSTGIGVQSSESLKTES